jgi:hypothetical protein
MFANEIEQLLRQELKEKKKAKYLALNHPNIEPSLLHNNDALDAKYRNPPVLCESKDTKNFADESSIKDRVDVPLVSKQYEPSLKKVIMLV